MLFIAGVALQVLTYRKERAVRPRRIVIGQAAAFGSMVAFSVITLRPPDLSAWVLLLGAGIAGGVAYARFVNVRSGDRGVTMSYTLPWLVTWAVLMVITQLASVFAQSVPVIIYGLAIINLGVNLGMNGRILGTYRALSGGAVAALFGLAVIGVGLVGPTKTALAQSTTGELPPGVESAIVDGTEPNDAILSHGEAWVVDNAQVAGAYVRYYYSMAGIPISYMADGDQYSGQIFPIVDVTWFASVADAEAAFAASRFGQASDLDLGLDYPTFFYGVGVKVHKGTAVVDWRPGGGTRANPDSPGGIAGAEHVVALVIGLEQVEVDQVRTNWFGTPPPEVTETTVIDGVQPGGGVAQPQPDRDLQSAAVPVPDAGPLDPVRAAAATAVASIILAGGSLLQLTDRFDPVLIMEELRRLRGESHGPAATDAVPPPDDGRVFVHMPWDEGGPTWVSAEDALRVRDMQAGGYVWDRRWGWVQGDEAATRQANADLGRDQWLARDPVADIIVSDIMASRDDLAATLAELEHAERIDDIRGQESQAMIDAWRARIADNRYHWWSGVAVLADVAFTAATGGLSAVRPIGQYAIRGGMHIVAGQAQGWSENELDGRAWDGQAFARGATIGAVRAAVDFGADGAIAVASRVMPTVRTALSGLRESAEVPDHLVRARELLDRAVPAADQMVVGEGLEAGFRAVDREAALEVLREGSRLRSLGSNLGELEAAGQVTRTEAQLIRQVWTETFDAAAESGAKDVFGEFQQRYGGGLKEILVGDQGSSARRFAVGSLKTDADRTILPVFEPDVLKRIAGETGETVEQVNMRLTDEVTAMWRESTADSLSTHNLTLNDFDAGSYSGFGRSATADDAYDASWVMQRQESGTTMVVRPGEAATYRAGGGAITDQAQLNSYLAEAADSSLDAARVSTDSALTFMNDQAEAVARSTDAKTAAKAFARQAWAAGRQDLSAMAGTAPNPGLRQLAESIVAEPQDQLGLLREAGYTPDEFIRAMQAESARITDAFGM